MKRELPARPIAERFWAKVQKTNTCWLWTGSVRKCGHGQLQRGRRGMGVVKVHRLSWELHRGPIPEGMCVCHKCDVPACVNPDHLFLGTKQANIRDMLLKNRQARGVVKIGRGHAVTSEQVRAIRAAPKEIPHKTLAVRYGVCDGTIRNIRLGLQRKSE